MKAVNSMLVASLARATVSVKKSQRWSRLSRGSAGALLLLLVAPVVRSQADARPTSGGGHWSYQVPKPETPPPVRDPSWPRGPLDQFVLAQQEQRGLRPAAEASREALLRRWSLDLIGLPPTDRDLDAFLADVAPGADRRAVDRLLASPHFGERWASPWLDLARYADTDGFNIDGGRSIWKYRDWVIGAFNRDLPFDQFTIQQIAGDMLADADQSTRIATGFHRNTRRNTEGGVDAKEARWEQLLDRVNTTAAIWLGSTIGCAQCHDHKYDPFGQREYYELLAFFETAEEPSLDATSPVDRARRTRLNATLKRLRAQDPVDAAEVARVAKEIKSIPRVTTLVMRERASAGIPKTHFRDRGSYVAKGELVEAGTPAALHEFGKDLPRNRLGLARWLVDDRNPLVARVTVNRYWAELFGRGLVTTVEDFGVKGAAPTHPGLLDWLATDFMAQGWSTKRLLRTIVLSATYRQASVLSPTALASDPANRWFTRGARFRLDAERIRDAFLTASGQLSRRLGGPSVFPVQADTSGVIPINKTSTRWRPSPGEDRYRRGIYTYWRRTMLFTALAAFDAPTREFCTPRRSRTNSPLQALVGMNDPAFFDAA
ncbi:MAG: hypothetical protein CMJ90_18025, partial [Planctomycetes bacterium]|nr:hypothetical protein [Planctomycetota bacterium]